MIGAALRVLGWLAAGLILSGAPACAAPLAAPSGETILVVSGDIANTNDGGVARFDMQMLEAIGTVKLTTLTPWYDAPCVFEGVSMRALMSVVGARGTEVMATALNDYRRAIPMSDFDDYEVVLAMKRDGELMPIRDKGPLFIIYPFDSDSRLRTEQYYSRAVWQLKELNVR
jgi:hypothetical protein